MSTLRVAVTTNRDDTFYVSFPLNRDQVRQIMAKDYPDARVDSINLNAR